MNERTPWQCYELVLLALVIWREARGEHDDTKAAVGCSIRNRVRNPKWWGQDWASVISKKWQYSSMTAPNDPQLSTWPTLDDAVWETCLNIASLVMNDQMNSPMPGADSYYDSSISPPDWTKTAKFVGTMGRLSFFNVDGDTELPIAV